MHFISTFTFSFVLRSPQFEMASHVDQCIICLDDGEGLHNIACCAAMCHDTCLARHCESAVGERCPNCRTVLPRSSSEEEISRWQRFIEEQRERAALIRAEAEEARAEVNIVLVMHIFSLLVCS